MRRGLSEVRLRCIKLRCGRRGPAGQAHVHADTIGQVKAELEALDDRAKSSRLEDKVDDGFARLDAKIDTGLAGLNTKIDRTKADLEAKIDQARAEMYKIKWEIIRWTIGIVVAICSLQGFIIVNVLR
ncbi:hypothetical protein [Pseudoduganella sp. OTU4001]|uniref:hypothetical protein n=1 Tax=Pseudoduganella sp. OTU4001 TaxID=3043854 RepID=UPI00313D708F